MTDKERKRTIFIVDDDVKLLKAMKQSASSVGNVLAFGSPGNCLSTLGTLSCDLLVSDVNMPEMDGLTLLSQVKAMKPHLPVLIVSAFGDIPMAVKAVKQGAFDFLQKPLDESTFIPALERGLAIGCPPELEQLTDTEREVLRHVAQGKGNKEIAYLIGRSVRTIENHRYRIMQKLGVDSSAALIKRAISSGLVQLEDSSRDA
jgi:two-component system, LuxR family, response regulator FixJ